MSLTPEALAMIADVIGPIVSELKQAHQKEVDALLERVKHLESRPAVVGEPGPKGDPGPVGESIKGEPGRDGVSPSEADIQIIVERCLHPAIEKALSILPKPIDGKDGISGIDGRDGRDGLPGVPGQPGEKGIDGRHGIDGKDGADGLDLKDLDISLAEDGRTIIFKMANAERTKEWRLTPPIPLHTGLFDEAKSYAHGDAVTWGGSMFIAQKASPVGKPGESSDWLMAVQRGREGKSGADGKPGQKGQDGRDGKDLTQMGPDGSKWSR